MYTTTVASILAFALYVAGVCVAWPVYAACLLIQVRLLRSYKI